MQWSRTNADIHTAVRAWCGEWKPGDPHQPGAVRASVCTRPGDPVEAEATYGHISDWDVSQVTDMNKLFYQFGDFNENISLWDVGNVTNMMNMFHGAKRFNQDLSRWQVGNVTNMYAMFCDARSFNQDISRWQVQSVEDMKNMFASATSFNQDLSNWQVNTTGYPYSVHSAYSATRLDYMFDDTPSLNQKPGWYYGQR